jgi:hypothetical protein
MTSMEHGSPVGHLLLILWGFAFGIPFVAMKSFIARLAFSATLAVLTFAIWTQSAVHGDGWFITYYMAILIAVGSFLAATMKVLWRPLANRLWRGPTKQT